MSNKILVCIVGGSGSGKSTLEDEIIINDGFSKAISTTTRERREGEHDGREYYFVSNKQFTTLLENNELLENVTFDGNSYGLSKAEFYKNNDHLVFVVEPNGLKQILSYIEKNNLEIIPLIIFSDITEKERFKNMVKRGDNPIKVQERLKSETIVENFKEYGFVPDIKISKLTPTTSETVMEDIYKFINLLEKGV